MKKGKLFAVALSVTLILAACIPGYAFAAEQKGSMPAKADFNSSYHRGNQRAGFVDSDGNGICDYYQNNETIGRHFYGEDGAYCTYSNCINTPLGAQYQDTNNDGVCDNWEDGIGNGSSGGHESSGHESGGHGGGHGSGGHGGSH